jgi:hypothetical protein
MNIIIKWKKTYNLYLVKIALSNSNLKRDLRSGVRIPVQIRIFIFESDNIRNIYGYEDNNHNV